jgi:hypothetical protein
LVCTPFARTVSLFTEKPQLRRRRQLGAAPGAGGAGESRTSVLLRHPLFPEHLRAPLEKCCLVFSFSFSFFAGAGVELNHPVETGAGAGAGATLPSDAGAGATRSFFSASTFSSCILSCSAALSLAACLTLAKASRRSCFELVTRRSCFELGLLLVAAVKRDGEVGPRWPSSANRSS